VTVADLNNDDRQDILFSAGRHDIRRCYALINLGPNTTDNTKINWSDPVYIGPKGRYTQIDVFTGLSTLKSEEVAVLLVGGSESDSDENNTPSELGRVTVSGCETGPDSCKANRWRPSAIWKDINPKGDRNGALAPSITNGETPDPAIVLSGEGGVAIYLPDVDGNYKETAEFVVTPSEISNNTDRGQALDVGFVGNLPGVVVGAKTFETESPAPPLIAIIQDIGENPPSFKKFTIDNGREYPGNEFRFAMQPNGVALGDWNGDEFTDIAATSFIKRRHIEDPFLLPQWYYEVQEKRTGPKETSYPLPTNEYYDISKDVALNTNFGGRSIASGILFPDNNLPDIVIGGDDDTIRFLANKGTADDGTFLGFEERGVYKIEFEDPEFEECSIRDLMIVKLKPCYKSVIGACSYSGNFILHYGVDDPNFEKASGRKCNSIAKKPEKRCNKKGKSGGKKIKTKVACAKACNECPF